MPEGHGRPGQVPIGQGKSEVKTRVLAVKRSYPKRHYHYKHLTRSEPVRDLDSTRELMIRKTGHQKRRTEGD